MPDLAVQFIVGKQFLVRTHGGDPPAVEDQDAVGVLHGGEPLCNDDFRRRGNELFEPHANQRIRLGVDGAGRIVENQNFRFLEQCPCDAETLFLPAGDVRTALLDVRVIPVGELRDEFVRLCKTACLLEFRVGRVRVAPAQVFLDRAGEQHVLLQNDRHLVA